MPNEKNPKEPDFVKIFGNADAKILAEAFEEYAKGGLTLQERQRIEKIDDILKDADIVISKNGHTAGLVQEDGSNFVLAASKEIAKKNPIKNLSFYKEVNDDLQLETYGNADAKVLTKVFKEYSKDGLTISEREKIEQLDEVLKNADIVIRKNGNIATIAQGNYAFTVHMPSGKGR